MNSLSITYCVFHVVLIGYMNIPNGARAHTHKWGTKVDRGLALKPRRWPRCSDLEFDTDYFLYGCSTNFLVENSRSE